MQPGWVGYQYELLVCKPSQYISGTRVHVKHLSRKYIFIQLNLRQGSGYTICSSGILGIDNFL